MVYASLTEWVESEAISEWQNLLINSPLNTDDRETKSSAATVCCEAPDWSHNLATSLPSLLLWLSYFSEFWIFLFYIHLKFHPSPQNKCSVFLYLQKQCSCHHLCDCLFVLLAKIMSFYKKRGKKTSGIHPILAPGMEVCCPSPDPATSVPCCVCHEA